MVWRTAVVENPARLSSRDAQLVISVNEEDYSIPFEDLAVLVLDGPQISLTKPVLERATKSNTAVIICDEVHMPSGLLLPFLQHSRASEVIHLQTRTSVPFKKRCWQTVVRTKLNNQASVLKQLCRGGEDALFALAKRVSSGDKENIEAQAAKRYWTALFGPPFKRGADITVNAGLNYGYAVLRAAVARGLTARGLIPAIGIHHQNKLNAFNLADDFLEPFRPLIDLEVTRIFSPDIQEFGAGERHQLVDILNRQMCISGESLSILRAVEAVGSSFVEALRTGKPEKMVLPEMLSE